MAICPICIDENSARFEHVNFHQINRAEGYELQAQHQDHWACKPCSDIWLALSNKCPNCREVIPDFVLPQVNASLNNSIAPRQILLAEREQVSNLLSNGASVSDLVRLASGGRAQPGASELEAFRSEFPPEHGGQNYSSSDLVRLASGGRAQPSALESLIRDLPRLLERQNQGS